MMIIGPVNLSLLRDADFSSKWLLPPDKIPSARPSGNNPVTRAG